MAGPFDLITGAFGQTEPVRRGARVSVAAERAEQCCARAWSGRLTCACVQACARRSWVQTALPLQASLPAQPARRARRQRRPTLPIATAEFDQDSGGPWLDHARPSAIQRAQSGLQPGARSGVRRFRAAARSRQMVSQMFNVNQSDPTKIGQMLMNMNSATAGAEPRQRCHAPGQRSGSRTDDRASVWHELGCAEGRRSC